MQLRGRIGSWVARALVVAAVTSGHGPIEVTQAAEVSRTRANQIVELRFSAARPHADPFNQITLDVLFTDPNGKAVRAPAFWDGKDVWKVRYASSVVGNHRFKSDCSDAGDPGLNGVEGAVEVTAAEGDNPLYRHGPLRVADDHRHFEHLDGTPFLWLGDTWWMSLSDRLKWPREFTMLADDRKAKGFNVVQIVAGLYPDQPAFDPRSANEGGFAWEKDYRGINPAYFDAADQRIFYLVDQGIVPCIVGAWGYHLPWMGPKKMKQHLRYIEARWGALPVVWCGAGEFNLPYYLTPGFPNHGEKQTADWAEVFQYFRSINVFRRPFTAHPTGIPPLSARLVLKETPVFDFDMLQTGHGDREVLEPTINALRASLAAEPPMPVVEAEVTYEALLGKTPAQVPRLMCWACYLNGAAGFTYGANGIWQLNRKDKPYGNSPWGGNYGPIPWDESMHLPGSTQVGMAANLLRSLGFEKFTPHPQWAAFANAPSPEGFGKAEWIWFPEGDPSVDAPVGARYFRKTFELPPGRSLDRATLMMTADDRFTAWLNGKEIGSGADWHRHLAFRVEKELHPGKNVMTVRAENVRSEVAKNPAGLIGQLTLQFQDGSTLTIGTDETWRCARAPDEGWQKQDADEGQWLAAKALASFGGGPWGGDKSSPAGVMAPFSSGITDGIRVTYVPTPQPIHIRELPAAKQYRAEYFDPVTGQRTPAGETAPKEAGDWTVGPPDNCNHDWVVIVNPSS